MTWQTIGECLDAAAARHGAQPLLRYAGQTRSVAEVSRQTVQVALLLRALGVGIGDRVALMVPNGFEFPIIWLALARLGAVAVPLNTGYQDDDLSYTLNDADAHWLAIDGDALPRWERVRERVPAIRQPLVVAGAGAAPFWRLVADAPTQGSFPDLAPDALLNIQYTSGTTGLPKGCMLSHAYWLGIGAVAADVFGLQPGDVDLTAQPFFYMDPQWNLIACLRSGATLAILPRFSPSTFWQAVGDECATVVYLIGSMPLFLLQQPEQPARERGHRLRLVLCSGIHPQYHAEFERRWGVPWREAYGMTETGVDLVMPVAADALVGSGAMGWPIATKQARVVDASGADVADGVPGELLVRGQPMMLGYWNNPAASAAALRDGWFHTGDLVVRDAHGCYAWRARLSDTIRRAGENIAAAEVERVLLTHPAVRDAAVVAVPDALRGQEVKAYLVLRPGWAPDPEAILDLVRTRLARFKVPRYVAFVADLPRTASERVEKHRLVRDQPDLRRGSYDASERIWR